MKHSISLLFLVAAFVAVQGLSDEASAHIAKLSKECAVETKVSSDEVEKLRKRDWSSKDVTVREFVKCLTKKIVMNANGKFDKEQSTAIVTGSEKQKVSDTLDKCEKQVGEVILDTAWDFAKCYFSIMPEHSVF